MQVWRQDSVTHLVPASVVAISVGSTLTDKGVRGRDKLKREDTFPLNDRTVFVIRSPLDGLSLDDMMMISNQERVPYAYKYTSLPFPRSVQVLFLLITNPYLESEQGLRRTLSRIKREENGVHQSLLHFGQSQRVRQSNMRKFTAEFLFFSSLNVLFFLCVALRWRSLSRTFGFYFLPPTYSFQYLVRLVWHLASANAVKFWFPSAQRFSTQASQCKLYLFGSCLFRV